MRVGSSPIYFIPGQEPQLDKYSNYLKSKEKEAYILLKEKQFLKDSEQEPAIRVALREIKDFAIPFRTSDEEIIWKYFTAEESEYKNPKSEKKEEKQEAKEEPEADEQKEKVNIFDSERHEKSEEEKAENKPKKAATKIPKKSSPKSSRKPAKKAEDSKFFNRVKDYLEEKKVEILGIEEIAISKIIFKVREQENSEEILIVAYNKKRILEDDILKAYKKAEALNLNYKILCFGEPAKKITNIIDASKALKNIEVIE